MLDQSDEAPPPRLLAFEQMAAVLVCRPAVPARNGVQNEPTPASFHQMVALLLEWRTATPRPRFERLSAGCMQRVRRVSRLQDADTGGAAPAAWRMPSGERERNPPAPLTVFPKWHRTLPEYEMTYPQVWTDKAVHIRWKSCWRGGPKCV